MKVMYKTAILTFFNKFPAEIPWGAVSIHNYLEKEGLDGGLVLKITSQLDLDQAIKQMRECGVNLIGLSAMNIEREFVMNSYNHLRKEMPDARYVFGGVLFSTMPELVDKDAMVVIGPGEILVKKLLTGEFEYGYGSVRGEHLDDYDFNPMPDGEMLGRFARPELGGEAVVLTSRGCPFQCTFCLSKELRRTKMSYYELADVLAYIRECHERFSYDRFFISDDIFFTNPDRVAKFCDGIDSMGYKLLLRAMSHAKINNLEMYKRAAQSGFYKIAIGAESGDNEVLKSIGKSITTDDIERSLLQIKQAGMEAQALFIIGHPMDTRETIEKTIAMGAKLKNKYNISSWYSLAQPFPGTEFGNQAALRGTKIKNTHEEYSIRGVSYIPEGLTVEYLLEARKRGMYMSNAKYGNVRYHIVKRLQPEKLEVY